MNDVAIPEGFRLHVHKGASYFQTLGDLYVRERPDGLVVIGLHVSPQHCNRLGIPHGGMLATLADTALGMGLHMARRTRGQAERLAKLQGKGAIKTRHGAL